MYTRIGYNTQTANRSRQPCHLPNEFLHRTKLMLTHPRGQDTTLYSATLSKRTHRLILTVTEHWIAKYPLKLTGCHSFPLSNFKYFLTLSSGFFSSFAHATCSLSVSRPYLALDEIYHRNLCCVPKQHDSLSRYRTRWSPGHVRDFHPLWCPVPRDFYPGHAQTICL